MEIHTERTTYLCGQTHVMVQLPGVAQLSLILHH